MQKIAVDIGFGSTKIKTHDNLFKFPSAISLQKIMQAEIIEDEKLEFEGQKYLVGDSATRDALTTKDFSFLLKYAPLLLYKAFIDGKLNLNNEISLITGLSLLNWNQKKDFAERISDFVINKNHINKLNISVVPQGKGIFIKCLKEDKELNSKLVIIVDIGYNTLDVIPFDNGKPLASEAWATNQGMNLVINEIRTLINKKYGVSFNETKVNQIIQKKLFVIEGEKIFLDTIIDEEFMKYQGIVFNELQTRNADLFKSAEKVIIAGGGGYAFNPKLFKQKSIILANDELEYCNVQGYWDSLI